MKNVLLSVYTDMILSLHTGSVNGNVAVSKPIYIITIIEAIESGALKDNWIDLDNEFIRNRFGQLYEQANGNRKGYESSFFVRPYFHLDSAPFYHLIWKKGVEYTNKSITPSAKFLRENLIHAKLEDELWNLLQDVESRAYLKRSIINRYLTNKQ